MPDIGSYLFNPNPGPADTLVYALGAVFVVGLALGLLIFVRRERVLGARTPLARVAGRTALAEVIISGLGLLFAVAAYFQVPVMSARIWLVALLAADLSVFGYQVYYLRTRLPGELARYRREIVRQRYFTRPSGKKSAKQRGKKRKKK